MVQKCLLLVVAITFSSFQTVDSGEATLDTVTKDRIFRSDTLKHRGEIVIRSAEDDFTLINLLSSPFAVGLIGVFASLAGFWFNDYLNRRNQLWEYKTKLMSDFSQIMSRTILYSNQAKIKENWINFYNACKGKGVESIPQEQILKEHERLDNFSTELLKLTAELNGLRSQFEFKILKGEDREFDKRVMAFHSARINFKDMDFEKMDQEQLAEIQPRIPKMAQEQLREFRPTQEKALNDVMRYLTDKIK